MKEKRDLGKINFTNCVEGETLNLPSKSITVEDLQTIFNFLNFHKEITAINFSNNRLHDEGVKRFTQLNQHIITVFFDNNYISAEGACHFAGYNVTARKVSFWGNSLKSNGAGLFALNNLMINDINLGQNQITDIKIFAKWNSATTVGLSMNPIGSLGVQIFAQFADSAFVVDFSGTGVDAIGIGEFAKINNSNGKITEVDFSFNPIGNEGLKNFAKKNKKVVKANFSHAKITDQGIYDFVEHNTFVTSVDFSDNLIGRRGYEALIASKVIEKFIWTSEQGENVTVCLNELNFFERDKARRAAETGKLPLKARHLFAAREYRNIILEEPQKESSEEKSTSGLGL